MDKELVASITASLFDRLTAPLLPQPYAPVRTDVWSGKWFYERSHALFGASLWFVWRSEAARGIQIAVEYFFRED